MRLRRLILARPSLFAMIVLAVAGAGAASLTVSLPHDGPGHAFATGPLECSIPVDVSMLFDRSGSMGSPSSKMTNAKAAAISFIDAFAGSPTDTDLTPHQMAATSFSTSATTDQVLTTNATAMRNAINGYVASGNTNLGWGLWLAEQQLEPPTDPDVMTSTSTSTATDTSTVATT